ncbi:MAG: tRNA 2-thiouridine(34) synthase MnmA [Succinivibrionaceae bacterium]|nr:tRNA 2-thiouridine(34) synthase MnmA [Succinivibrionaceae bacterium]
MKKKVIVGMSGGVDSSVSAYLLMRQGYEVTGLFMKNWEEDDDTGYCSAAKDLADAQAVCDRLGFELKTVNFAAEYWDGVFQHFLDEYASGRTPNPDILCNSQIKFKAFMDYAFQLLGADLIATGHFVRTRADPLTGKRQLLRGADPAKDQSYFLHAVSHERLGKALFPVGDMIKKTQVRALASELGLKTADKKDSTGICFIGERRFKEFLRRFLPARPGNIETPEGRIIGRHDGLMYHTLGQRKGLGIGGLKDAGDEPWYAAEKDLARNVLIAVQGSRHPLLMSTGLIAEKLSMVDREKITREFRCAVKTRYRQPDIPCTVRPDGEDRIRIDFDEPVAAVTPGQSAVLYNAEVCLGGGVITDRIRLV